MQQTSRLFLRGFCADSLSISSLPHRRVSLERNLEGDQFMRRYQKWLTLGLMALTPGVTLAGPLNSPLLKQSTTTNSPAASQSAQKKGGSNQEIANKIAAALKKAKLSGYEIEISVEKGVATLDGMVGSPAQREAAAKVVGSVSGISRVNNRLGVGDSAPRMPAYQA